NWIDKFPPSIRPYLFLTRLDKPAGTWLLYWPCTWSIGMAAYNGNISPSQTLWMLSVFGVGALVMRGAGCTINDMWDVKFDKKVERTRIRPLASGALTMPKATAFLAGQLTVGLGVLLQLNMYSIALGALSLVPVAVYPLMKRITYWPQTVLGLAFNWGALLGWPALLGGDLMNWSVTVPMYVAGISWTLVYDTIYAHQDKRDDVHAGVKSTALLFGDKSRLILSGFAVSTIALLCIAGAANGHGPIYYATTVLGGGGHLAWQLKTVDFNNVANCWHRFKSNIHFGAIIFAGIALDYLYKRYIEQSEKEDTSDKV
ncbi:4-hydroxybenzoate polyprenyl transferase, partial [Ramicandelaber brevisporus]